MRGSIMPEPLAMPPTRNVPMSVRTSTAYSFGNGSVVMMPRAAAAPPSALSAGDRLRNAGAQLVHLQVDADHAGRGDQHLLRVAADRRGGQRRHLARVGHALRAGAGVGAAAVGDDGARASAGGGEVVLADEQRRRLGEVEREHAGGLGRRRRSRRATRSGLPLALMPQCRPLARKPDGAVMPPGIALEVSHGGPRPTRRCRRRRAACARSRSRTMAYWPQLRNSGHEWQSWAIFSGTQVCGTIEKPSRTKNRGSCANAHRRA